jgi:hypothetical protein
MGSSHATRRSLNGCDGEQLRLLRRVGFGHVASPAVEAGG